MVAKVTPPLIVIVGPTASGKSDLAMSIAQEYDGELICADSRTVYKDLDIGTAKPTKRDQALVRHHMLDLVEPGQIFTAADFKRLANLAIEDISARGKLPIMVGGTGLYVDSVIFNYQFGEPANPAKRTELLGFSVEHLQQICREKNIELPINSKNKRHLIRAIELGGLPKANRELRANTIVVGISTEREILRERISRRAHLMLQAGIFDEVRCAGQKYGWQSEAMTGNIYPIFKDLIAGQISEGEAIDRFIKSDMSLAKRQMTWFKRNPYIIWGMQDELKVQIEAFLHVVKR